MLELGVAQTFFVMRLMEWGPFLSSGAITWGKEQPFRRLLNAEGFPFRWRLGAKKSKQCPGLFYLKRDVLVFEGFANIFIFKIKNLKAK